MIKTRIIQAVFALSLILPTVSLAEWKNLATQCSAIPQDNVYIKQNQVEIYGTSGNLIITKEGDVLRDNQKLALSDTARVKAKSYQASLRHDLPYLLTGANQQIDSFHNVLDDLLVKVNDGKGREQLKTMKSRLQKQMQVIIQTSDEGLELNIDSIKTIGKETQNIIQQGLGAIAQETLNGMTIKELKDFSKVNNLQSALQKTWVAQYAKSRNFVDDACGKIRSLEDQRIALLRDLPA